MLNVILLTGVIIGVLTAGLNLWETRQESDKHKIFHWFIALISASAAAVFFLSLFGFIQFMPLGGQWLIPLFFMSQVALCYYTFITLDR